MIQSNQAKVKGKEFTLDDVTGPVKLAEKITIAPGNTMKVKGITQMKGHLKRVNAITELVEKEGSIKSVSVMTVPTYTMCKPGSNRVTVVLRNMTQQPVTLRKGRVVATLMAANLVPNKLALRYLSKSTGVHQADAEQNENGSADTRKTQDKDEQVDRLFSKLDLGGIQDWMEKEQSEVKELLADYNDIFALNPMELGKTDIVKHTIKVTNLIPFKERYWQIPPHQFEEVRKHLQEMEEIGAIHRSSSPWASPVVLVRKKDGTLQFCIDL